MTSKFNYFTQMGCRRVAPLLFAQSHNADLSPRDAVRLNAHLQSCLSCRREAVELADVGKMLRQNAPAAPLPASDLWSRIEAEIAPQNENAPLPSRRPEMVRRAPFVPALGGMAWAGSCAIVIVGGAWMTFGGGFWGRHHSAQMSAAGIAQITQPPATLTLIPPSPVGTAARPKQESAPAHSAAIYANRALAKNQAVAKKSVRKAAPVLTPRVDPFIPLASETPRKAKMPSGLVSLSHAPAHDARLAAMPATAPTPAPAAQTVVDVASVQSPAVPSSGTLTEEVASHAVSAPIGELTTADTTAATGATKTIVAASVYANASAASSDDFGRNGPLPSGVSVNGAFSVTDAAAKVQRQRALFSYSRP